MLHKIEFDPTDYIGFTATHIPNEPHLPRLKPFGYGTGVIFNPEGDPSKLIDGFDWTTFPQEKIDLLTLVGRLARLREAIEIRVVPANRESENAKLDAVHHDLGVPLEATAGVKEPNCYGARYRQDIHIFETCLRLETNTGSRAQYRAALEDIREKIDGYPQLIAQLDAVLAANP
jgi:hypothetical protein